MNPVLEFKVETQAQAAASWSFCSPVWKVCFTSWFNFHRSGSLFPHFDRSFQRACLPVGIAASHMCGLYVAFTPVAWPEPGTTVEAPILALPPSTSLLGLGLSFLMCHLKGDRFSNLLHSISSLKFYSHHSQEGYSIMESTTLHLSGMQSYDPGGKLKEWWR